MRGGDTQQGHMWSYLQPEQRVPQDHLCSARTPSVCSRTDLTD